MATATSFPTYAYSASQTPQVVASQAALTALGPTWFTSPVLVSSASAPTDTIPGVLSATDIRLQQMLVEQRVTNQMLAIGFGMSDDPVNQIRPDVLLNDSGLNT
jgi:hypothetical protein